MNSNEEFRTTRWSRIVPEIDGESECASNVYEDYWRPLCLYLVRKGYCSVDAAPDYVSDFYAEKIIKGDFLTRASRDCGRFRNFLMKSLKYFVFSKIKHSKTRAKSPPDGVISIEGASIDLPDPSLIEGDFISDDAQILIDTALVQFERECELKGELVRWKIFEETVILRALSNHAKPDYRQLVSKYGLKNEQQVANISSYARRRFRELLRQEVVKFSNGSRDAQDELKFLIRRLEKQAR